MIIIACLYNLTHEKSNLKKRDTIELKVIELSYEPITMKQLKIFTFTMK